MARPYPQVTNNLHVFISQVRRTLDERLRVLMNNFLKRLDEAKIEEIRGEW
jgi:hypothetical protein